MSAMVFILQSKLFQPGPSPGFCLVVFPVFCWAWFDQVFAAWAELVYLVFSVGANLGCARVG